MFRENLNKILTNNDGLEKNGAAALEALKIEKIEKGDYISEVDESRMDKAADAMVETFGKEVLVNWTEMSLDERAEKFNEYQKKLGEAWGIEAKGVIFENMNDPEGFITYGYNSGDGYVHLNEKLLEDPNQLEQMLNTTTHEMRHQFQTEVLQRPKDFKDIPKLTKLEWWYNFNNYISGDGYNFEAYAKQGIEVDARKCGQDVVDRYMAKLR